MPAPMARDHRPDFVVGEHLVEARLLDVDDLAAQRQDGLERAVARLLGRAAGRVALDDVDLAVAGRCSEQSASLPGSVVPSSSALAACEVARLAGGVAGPRRVDASSRRSAARSLGFSSKNSASFALTRSRRACDLAVAELRLGLAFELRVRELDGNDRRQALTHVLAGEVVFLLLEQARSCGRSR